MSKLTTGRIKFYDTKNFVIEIEEDYFIATQCVKVAIKDKNIGLFGKRTRFKHRISVPVIYFNTKKENALWDDARNEIEKIAREKVYELEMDYQEKEKM